MTIRHPLTNLTVFAQKTDAGCILVSVRFGIKINLNGIASYESNDRLLGKYALLLKGFLNGKKTNLDAIPIDLTRCTPFTAAVLNAARKVPWGSVVSYSELAKRAGYPKAVRAAASVMRNNRFPLVIPCHRVVAKGGKIGGFMGAKTGPFVNLKKKLLRQESPRPIS